MVNGLIHILLKALRSSISLLKCLNSAVSFFISKLSSFKIKSFDAPPLASAVWGTGTEETS